MNYYFFPMVDGCDTDVTLANFGPGAATDHGEMYCYAAWLNGQDWRIEPFGTVPQGELKSVSARAAVDRGYDGKNGILALFMYDEELPSRMPELPHKPIQDTSPQWRANIRLRTDRSATSYQGEYPGAMANLTSGTLVSVCPLAQYSDSRENLLLFANLMRQPVRESRKLSLVGLQGTVFDTVQVMTNTCNTLEIRGEWLAQDTVCAVSDEVAGIPLYFTRDPGGSQMSLEHSHPPTELSVFGIGSDRRRLVNTMKTAWLGR